VRTVQRFAYLIVACVVVRHVVHFCYRCRLPRRSFDPRACYVLVSNHRSFMDPLLAGCFYSRPISFFARANLWRVPIIRQCLDFFGGLPVDRDEPQMGVMQRTVEWLRTGRNVLIFPEGTRTRDGRLGRLRSGAALFARRAGVPVLPVYLHRTERAWPRGCILPRVGVRVGIRFGPVLRSSPSLPPKIADEALIRRVERWMLATEAEFHKLPARTP